MEAVAANLLTSAKAGSLGRTGRFTANPGAFQTAIFRIPGAAERSMATFGSWRVPNRLA